MVILQKKFMQFCKKILQTSTFLMCFSLTTDLLAADDAEALQKKAMVLGSIVKEDWFAGHKQAESYLGKELSAYAQKKHEKSFQLDEFRKSFTASGLAEIFGV
jgi:hypothetical protein